MPRGSAAAREAIAVLQRGWWLILLIAVLGAIAGALLLPARTITRVPTINISSNPYNSDQVLLDLGIPAEGSIRGPDLTNERITDRIRRLTGIHRSELEGRIQLVASPYSDSILQLQVESSGNLARDRRLLSGWLKAIRQDRLATVRRMLDVAAAKKRRSLARSRNRVDRKQIQRSLDRIETARAVIEPDVFVQRGFHIVKTKDGRIRLANAGVGLISGALFAFFALLAVALVDGRIRTRQGLISSFRAPLIADLGDPESNSIERLSAWIGTTGPAAVVNAAGIAGTNQAVGLVDMIPGLEFLGDLTGEALVVAPHATVVVLVRTDVTTVSDREWFDLELGQSEVERVGLVLV